MKVLPRSATLLLLALALLVATGCQRARPSPDAGDVKLDFTLQPDPPAVGPATARLHLTDPDGQPISGATFKLEGNMNHAGMVPVFAEAREVGPGRYQATLDLTMGGDWFVLVTGTLPDGRSLKRKIDVPGVQPR